MQIKNIFTICLLLFVAAAITVLTVKSLRSGPQSASAEPTIQNGVVVYYFHGNTRCPTCRNIEAYAHEAVESGFADELKNKQILWQVINYETPGNEHFAADYEFVAPIVVLVMFKHGKQVKWKGLPEVWSLVGNKDDFFKYVQAEIQVYLDDKKTASR
ncbi:MAG: nitrophenyl compound nitroreductase subunit ArsF family protein, partial [Thermoguttaceae bacterium]|jgi:thiol-disulfide isomerase/thioredoxin